MKRAILPLLLALVLLVSGCGDKSIRDNVTGTPTPNASVNPGELPAPNADGNIQLTASTPFYNEYFGIEVTVPAGWWIYEYAADNISHKEGVTGSMSGFDMSNSNGYAYMELLYYANLEDSTKDGHIDFYYLIENVEGITDTNEFCDDDNDYREGEDNGYTTVLLEQKPFTLGGTSGIVREFEVTHEEYVTYTTVVYTIDVGDGYFFSIDTSFYNSNNKAMDIIETHVADEIQVISGGSV